jgi:hypothetical protein
VVADSGDETVEVGGGGAVRRGGVEEFVDLFEGRGDFCGGNVGQYEGV